MFTISELKLIKQELIRAKGHRRIDPIFEDEIDTIIKKIKEKTEEG